MRSRPRRTSTKLVNAMHQCKSVDHWKFNPPSVGVRSTKDCFVASLTRRRAQFLGALSHAEVTSLPLLPQPVATCLPSLRRRTNSTKTRNYKKFSKNSAPHGPANYEPEYDEHGEEHVRRDHRSRWGQLLGRRRDDKRYKCRRRYAAPVHDRCPTGLPEEQISGRQLQVRQNQL